MALRNVVTSVTKSWAKQRKAEEREADRHARRRSALHRRQRLSVKQAAWDVMETAYRRAAEIKLLHDYVATVRAGIRQKAEEAKLPRAIVREVTEALERNRSVAWDEAIAELVAQNL